MNPLNNKTETLSRFYSTSPNRILSIRNEYLIWMASARRWQEWKIFMRSCAYIRWKLLYWKLLFILSQCYMNLSSPRTHYYASPTIFIQNLNIEHIDEYLFSIISNRPPWFSVSFNCWFRYIIIHCISLFHCRAATKLCINSFSVW